MSVRLDKWLWSVRLYKTRNLATEACKAGAVRLRGDKVKPSYAVKVGDLLTLRREDRSRGPDPLIQTIEVAELLDQRVGAKLVSAYAIDHTDPAMYERPTESATQWLKRQRGEGRPTKKERREIDAFLGEEQES